MSRSRNSIPVDVFNPAQVFACYGLMELAELLNGDVRCGFVGDEFLIDAASIHDQAGPRDPIPRALAFLGGASVTAVLPQGCDEAGLSWKKMASERLPDATYPSTLPAKPAKLVARLRNPIFPTIVVDVDHWAEEEARTQRDAVKFWAGAGGLPGVVMLETALDLVREDLRAGVTDPLNLQRPQSSSFRFDWRAGYVPMDIGWSLNNHSNTKNGGYPLVDVLAAIGLASARPLRPVRRDKLTYRYGVLEGEGHHPMFLRASLGSGLEGFARRSFEIQLGWPGKEGQARSIVNVVEIENQKENV